MLRLYPFGAARVIEQFQPLVFPTLYHVLSVAQHYTDCKP